MFIFLLFKNCVVSWYNWRLVRNGIEDERDKDGKPEKEKWNNTWRQATTFFLTCNFPPPHRRNYHALPLAIFPQLVLYLSVIYFTENCINPRVNIIVYNTKFLSLY